MAQRVCRLPYIYYSTFLQSNYGHPMLPTVFSFHLTLVMPNKANA